MSRNEGSSFFVLTRFLSANRGPLRSKTLSSQRSPANGHGSCLGFHTGLRHGSTGATLGPAHLQTRQRCVGPPQLATASFVAGLAHPVHCGQENVPGNRADVHLRLLNLDLFRRSADGLAVAMLRWRHLAVVSLSLAMDAQPRRSQIRRHAGSPVVSPGMNKVPSDTVKPPKRLF